jgi:LacI family transcriptional regulator
MHRILILIDATTGEGRAALTSVIRCLMQRPAWRLALPPGPAGLDLLGQQSVATLLDDADAAIIRLFDKPLVEQLAARRKPIVSLVRRHAAELGLPTVTTAGPAAAEQAVDHLADRLYTSIGYVGFARLGWHGDRRLAAEAAAARRNCRFDSFMVPRTTRFRLDTILSSRRLRAWLRDVPKPIGLVLPDDRLALQLLELCEELGLRVPRDVGLVGSGDDAALCDAANVPISSVDTGVMQIGEAACELLAAVLRGETPPHRYLDPAGVVLRQTSDVIATDDEIVADALHRIRHQATTGLTADELAAVMPLSRSGFERRFRAAVGRSPMQEIVRVRIAEAQRLLASTTLTLDAVADRCGFPSRQRFHAAFRAIVGTTPARARQESSSAKLPSTLRP